MTCSYTMLFSFLVTNIPVSSLSDVLVYKVCWDELLSAASNSREMERGTGADSISGYSHGQGRDRGRTACPRLYGHEGRFEGVWGLESFLCDGQTALASVSSDGTFRCAFPSTLNTLQSLRCNDDRDVGNRISSGNGRGSGDGGGGRSGSVTVTASRILDQWVLEAFRIYSVTTRHPSPTNSDDSAIFTGRERDREGGGWTGSVATVCVDRGRHLDVQSDIATRNAPSVAIHAVDSIPYPHPLHHSTSKPHPTCRLMAYGGAAGVLRVHSLDMHKDIVL